MDIRTGHDADGMLAMASPASWRSHRARNGLIARLLPTEEKPCHSIAWEADRAGTIRWVNVEAREALIGRNLLQDGLWPLPAAAAPIAHIAGVKIEVPGQGAMAGAWLFSGDACFDPCGGHFRGYRGEAWRESREDEPAADANGLAADALRGLVHELRTPLNAIVGFGELIDGQIDGEEARAYRSRTTRIAADAARLVAAIDELDAAARTVFGEREEGGITPGSTALALLRTLSRSCPSRKSAGLRWRDAQRLPSAALSRPTLDYLASRLISFCLGYAGKGEQIGGDILPGARGAATLCILVELPAALRDLDFSADASLSEPKGDWPFAPSLGLNFAYRLLASVGTALGANLDVQEGSIRLHLPAA